MARLGAAECLRSGVTTLVDAAYAGAAVARLQRGRAARDRRARGVRRRRRRRAGGRGDARRSAWTRSRPRPARSSSWRVSPHAPVHGRPAALRRAGRARARARPARRDAPRRVAPRARRAGRRHRASLARSGRPLRPPSDRSSSPSAGCSAPRRSSRTRCTSDDEDIAALAATGAAVAHCPRSNALLGCGVAPLARLRAAGIRVGLGTDSPSSALSLDIFDELRAAMLLARASAAIPRRSRPPRRCSWPRSTAPARSGSRTAARSRRGCSPTSSRCGSTARRSGPATTRLGARAGRLPGARDAGRHRRRRAVRCGFDRIRARPPRCRSRALAPPRSSRRRPPHDHLSHMIIWIRNRKGWVGARLLRARRDLRGVVHHRRRRHRQQRVALGHHRQRRRHAAPRRRRPRASARSRRRSRPTPRTRPPGSSSPTPMRARHRPADEAARVGPRRRAQAAATWTACQRLALAQAQVATNNSNQAQQLQQQALTSSPGNDSTFSGGTLGSLTEDPVTQAQAAVGVRAAEQAADGGRARSARRPTSGGSARRPPTASSSSCRRSPRTTSRRRSGSTTARPRRARATPRRRSRPTRRSSRSRRDDVNAPQVRTLVKQLKASGRVACTTRRRRDRHRDDARAAPRS